MSLRRRWDINTRTQLISLGPALLLTLLLISFFTFVRIQDLRQELNHTGQLIANQLAPATEYGVISGNNEVLESLLKATLATPNVRFLEVQDSANRILALRRTAVRRAQPATSGRSVPGTGTPAAHRPAQRFFSGRQGQRNGAQRGLSGPSDCRSVQRCLQPATAGNSAQGRDSRVVRPALHFCPGAAPGWQPVASDPRYRQCGQGDSGRRL
jgi:hypothetical protein